ncbi:MAG: DnaJ domain-containing protein, partial [Myxococcales bacterium]
DSLARYLQEQGTLTPAQYDELLAAMQDGLSAGAGLVAIGAVEPGEPLLARLREYARTRIAETYAMTSGRFSFYAGAEFASEVPSLDVPALAPLYEAARSSWPVKAFSSALAPHMRRYPVRTPEFAQQLAAAGLTTADLKLALAIDGRTTLRELLAQGKDLKHGFALLWYLTTIGMVRHEAAPTNTAELSGVELAEKARAPARHKRKPLNEPQLASLREDAVRILTSSYFRALNLDITADGEDVERAYHELATRFHPDSYPDADTAPIEDLLASVQERLSAAYRVLSDDARRKAYVNYLLSRSEGARTNAPVVEAEIALKRGEKLMKKGDWRGALQAFETAVSANAREPEYYSFLAFATFRAGEGTRVTWSMTGENNFVSKVFGCFVDMDAMIGKDFEKG